MTSRISPNSIDPTFPIAGVDNDTQGFRNNFANILNNFNYAAQEITGLQTSSVAIGTSNNLQGTVLANPNMQGETLLHYDMGQVIGTVTVNSNNGNSQQITPSGNIILSFSGWPAAGSLGYIRLRINVTNINYTVTIPSNVINGQWISSNIDSTNIISFVEPGVYVFDCASLDNGATIEMNDITRSRRRHHGGVNYVPDSGLPSVSFTNVQSNSGFNWNVTPGNVGTQFTSLAIDGGGNVNTYGNMVTHNIFADQSYTYVGNVASGFNLPGIVSTLILNPTGTIAAGTIGLWNKVNGQEISITSSQTISALTLTGNAGVTINGGVTTLPGNTPVKYIYVATANAWFRIV